jgi:predicted P-loop ATPase
LESKSFRPRTATTLFAEAVYRFKEGETWWEMPTEATLAEQDARFLEDTWTPRNEEFIRPQAKVLVEDILVECLELTKITKSEQMRGCRAVYLAVYE